jgi:hypothetical protein
MVRNRASFAFAVSLIMALGWAMAHAHAHKFSDASIRFSAPCQPAAAAFKAADQSKAVLRIDSTFHAENGEAPACLMRRARFGTVARAIPPPAPPWTFPPLLHRPPPANS